MKAFTLILASLLVGTVAFSQGRDKKLKDSKLSKDEAANLTTEQRLVHENNRKSKQGRKKGLSLKKKIRTEKKQARKAEHTQLPNTSRRKKHPKGN